jgi:hypothetical protein
VSELKKNFISLIIHLMVRRANNLTEPTVLALVGCLQLNTWLHSNRKGLNYVTFTTDQNLNQISVDWWIPESTKVPRTCSQTLIALLYEK